MSEWKREYEKLSYGLACETCRSVVLFNTKEEANESKVNHGHESTVYKLDDLKHGYY